MNKAIERQIAQIYAEVYKQAFNKTNSTALSNNDRKAVENALSNIEASQKYNDFAIKFAQMLAKKGVRGQKGLWRKYYEAAKSTHYIGLPKTWNAFETSVMNNAIRHNFQMIKSIPQRMKEILGHKYTSTLIEEVAKGNLPRGTFRSMLAKHGHKQATLIARTETAKLQTAILENRSTTLGSVAYEWLSSKDKRTRPSHRAMNGVIVFWRPDSQKPLLDNMRGNAGEFPNCRCTPQPIVDPEEQLKESYYKVYNYNTDKIERISRQDLLSAIQKGAL